MVLVFPNWHPKATVVTTTVLAPTTTVTTVTATQTAKTAGSIQNIVSDILGGPDEFFWTVLILWLTLALVYVIASRKEVTEDEQVLFATEEGSYFPWITTDWLTFYGLLGMAFDDETMYTPFRRECIQTIQQRFKHRPQLRILLEKGIVPLYIQDGGVSTVQTRQWSWNTEFPFIQLPRYEQAKRRAVFEFLIPHPRRARVLRFHELLGQNDWGFGVQARACNSATGKEPLRDWSKPTVPFPGVPRAIGAESAFEPILPLLPDKVLGTERSDVVDVMRWFLKNTESASSPLLHYTDLCIFRVEAGHWDPAELDSFVLGCAEAAKMAFRWPMGGAREQAMRELRNHGLVT